MATGMDARAFRSPLPGGVTVFEVNHPGVLEVKAARLGRPRQFSDTVQQADGLSLVEVGHPERLDNLGHQPAVRRGRR